MLRDVRHLTLKKTRNLAETGFMSVFRSKGRKGGGIAISF